MVKIVMHIAVIIYIFSFINMLGDRKENLKK